MHCRGAKGRRAQGRLHHQDARLSERVSGPLEELAVHAPQAIRGLRGQYRCTLDRRLADLEHNVSRAPPGRAHEGVALA